MRMWMIEPNKLCRKHLLGEHNEIHKAVGNLRHSGKWTKALIEKGFLEPQNFVARHKALVNEMLDRGYKHESPLDVSGLELSENYVDRKKAIADLKARCKECFK